MPKSQDKDDLLLLVNKTFKLYRCSPFYGLRLERSRLADSLSRHLLVALSLRMHNANEQHTPRSSFKGVLHDVKCKILSIAGWQSVNPHFKPLEFTITIALGGKAGPVSHTAIMLPATRPPDTPLLDQIASYPLLLMKMPGTVADQVAQWLQKTYDCIVGPLHIPTEHLESMVEWYTASLSDMPVPEDVRVQVPGARPFTHQHLELSYHIPDMDELSSITVSVRTEQLLKIFGIVHASRLTMMQAIQGHIRKTARINVSSMVLMRIGTPIAYITNSGKLKLIPNASKSEVLRWLEELAAIASKTLLKK